MEQGYWLDRKRAALRSARVATVAEARLIHYELAGRYSVRAANCGVEPDAGDAARVKTAVGRSRKAAMIETIIDEAQIESLIRVFYARVRKDALIGPLFEGAIQNWDAHLETLMAFWSSVMLTSGRYKGNPVAAHRKLAGAITPPMFDRWLALWNEATSELLLPAQAAALQEKAARIAESLKLALYFRVPPPRGNSPEPQVS